MHELSVASAVLNTAVKHAGDLRVEVLAMRVGRLRQVVPESLRFYWEIVARDTVCEDSRLELTEIDVRLHCSGCGREWEPMIPAFRCPDCAADSVSVMAAESTRVTTTKLKEQEAE